MPHCKVIRRIAKENRRNFKSLEEAQSCGFRLCNCCTPVAQKYRKERNSVKDLCKENGLTFKLRNGVIHVISRHDCWRIVTEGKNNSLRLYHRNTDLRRRKNSYKTAIRGFHLQSFVSQTITGYLKYIGSHDRYRDAHPDTEVYGLYDDPSIDLKNIKGKGTKKQRKEMAKLKRRERKAGMIRVNSLLDELSAMN